MPDINIFILFDKAQLLHNARYYFYNIHIIFRIFLCIKATKNCPVVTQLVRQILTNFQNS